LGKKKVRVQTTQRGGVSSRMQEGGEHTEGQVQKKKERGHHSCLVLG